MSNGLPTKAKVGIPGRSVNISPAVYFAAKRMESAGMLRPGQALMLAATLGAALTANRKPKKGKK